MNTSFKHQLHTLATQADIQFNGTRPWDIQVHNEDLYRRIFAQGSLGLGESYMDGWWDCLRLDELFFRIFSADLDTMGHGKWNLFWHMLLAKVTNQQTPARAHIVGEQHYDTGNDLFEPMLGPTMAYSCGYWKDAQNLDEAQNAKFDLICRKLGLEPGMTLLDIGCGWGTLMKYAVSHYGVKAVGVTISKEQAAYAQEQCRGLDIDIRLQDYRKLTEQFDRIVSVGMFEHVGPKNYYTYMEVAYRCLHDHGLFLLHTIGGDRSTHATDPWIAKYIFPNSVLPSIQQIAKAFEGTFVMEDWHNFGPYYDRTLMAWHQNFQQAWPTLQEHYSDRFKRMWEYYLLSCAALFRAHRTQLWQIVLSKHGVPGGWEPVR